MRILVTVIAEIALLLILRFFCKGKYNRGIVISAMSIYLIGVFMVTIGLRTVENAGGTNLILFHTFRRMFSRVTHGLQNWGFPCGLKELRWIGHQSLEGVVLNLLLLVPLGYLLPIVSKRSDMWWKVVAVGFAGSLLIETIQLITHRGWFDVDDLLLNTVGTVIGYVLYRQFLCKEESHFQGNV